MAQSSTAKHALVTPAFRFGGMGHDGHQEGVQDLTLLQLGQPYDFAAVPHYLGCATAL
jgi:hypothetical protein